MTDSKVKVPFFETDEVLSFRCFIQYNEKENEWWFEPMCPTAKHNFRQADRASIIELVQQRNYSTLESANTLLRQQLELCKEQRNRRVPNNLMTLPGLNERDDAALKRLEK